MARVRELQHQAIVCTWDLGRALFAIYEGKLWTQMTADGKALYDSWTKFCKKELGVDPKHGYRIMDVAANFTREQVTEIGVTKLGMIVRVAPEQRAKLLEAAKETPRSKLAVEVGKLAAGQVRDTGRDGFKGDSGKGRGGKGVREDGVAAKSTKVTIVRSEPRVVVELFKRGTTERARHVKDACGVEQCANGMVVLYALVETEKGLAIAVETRRDE
jgi:hypothetical protein